MTQSHTLTQGDYGKYIDFYLYDEDENLNTTPTDITSASINVFWRKVGDSTNSVSGTCTVSNGPSGYCKYLVGSTDTQTAGRYSAEVEVHFVGGAVSTWYDFYIFIREQLG